VRVGGVLATNVVFSSATQVTARTPAGSAGARDVQIVNPNGQSATRTGAFTYTTSSTSTLKPAPTAVSPGSGPTSGGTLITVTGTNFVSGATIKVGGKFATSVTFVSSTKLTARTPAMPVGGYPVLVYNPNGLWGNTSRGFLYVSGTTSTITGSRFFNNSSTSGAKGVDRNAGASATNINILHGDQSVFTRDISMGGNAYTEALQRELNLPFDTADALKRGQHVDGVTYDDARPVLRAVTENVMLEIQKTFDFFKATAASEKIDRIILSGGASRAEAFTEMLAERFDAPVEAFDPFKKVGFDAKKFKTDPSEIAPTVAVAVGLGLRRVGDR